MKLLSLEDFNQRLAASALKPRLKKDLRFVASTQELLGEDWGELSYLAVSDRTGVRGILLIEVDQSLHVLPYELKRGMASATTGRAQPIICDFCRTWQSGSRAGSIAFTLSSTRTVSYLCCADLQCSAHVRSKTSAAKTSRSQLREDMTTDERVARLQDRLRIVVTELQAPVFDAVQL